MNMNKVVLLGHAGADARIFENVNIHHNMLAFNIATNRYYIDKMGEKVEKTDWHQIRVYGKITAHLHPRILKGQAIFVEGELKNSLSSEKNGIRYRDSFIKANRVVVIAPSTPMPVEDSELENDPALPLSLSEES